MRVLRRLFGKVWLWVVRSRLEQTFARTQKEDGPINPRQHIYVFGDSLSDTGNVYQMVRWLCAKSATPSPPYYEGRFCDGPNWIDQLAEQMELSATPAWSGGTNFANGGAQTGGGVSSMAFWVPNIGEQLEFFAKTHRKFDPEAWVVLQGGHNNLLAVVHGKESQAASVALERLMTHLERLYRRGGRKFLVPNLIPLDRSPEAPAAQREFIEQWIEGFNTGLAIRLAAFRCDHPDACVFAPDFHQAMTDILDHPQAHGFGNVHERCYDAATDTVSVATQPYVWWDDCHPTARVQRYLAKSALSCFSEALPLLHEGIYPTDTLTYLSQFGNLSDSLS